MKRKTVLILIPLSIIFWLGVIYLSLIAYHKVGNSQFKKDYQNGDKVAQLYDLLGSGHYAKDLRKAGYTIPNDGGIRYDGFINDVTIHDKLDIKIVRPPKGEKSFSVYFVTNFKNQKVYCSYEFDRKLNLPDTDSLYEIQNKEKITESISLPKEEHERLLKQVRQEINDFLDNMYHQIYD